MSEQSGGSSAVWGVLAAIVIIVALAGGGIYLITDRMAAQAQAQAQIAQAQVQIVQAREDNRTERMQIFALTLKSMTVEHNTELTLLSVGVLILGILQLVQFATRPRG